MDDDLRVSIIMAIKDTAAYLPECLDSIINQTYQNWELIAINDHSSDNTPEILKAYAEKDARIRVFHSDRPKLIPTLKFGYPFCQGPLMNRMDSDDRMPPDKLEVMVREWRKYGKGHVVAGGTEHFRDDGEVGDGFRRYDAWLNEVAKNNLHLEQLYKECVIPSHCWMLHKDDLDAIGAFEPEIYPEDYDLTFRMVKHGLQIHGMDKVLHHWRDRSDRISRTWDEYKDNRYFEMKVKYFRDLHRDETRELVLWGTGRNGKDLAKLLIESGEHFTWVGGKNKKVGHNIYGVIIKEKQAITELNNPQVIVAVAAPSARPEIESTFKGWGLQPIDHYWFFC